LLVSVAGRLDQAGAPVFSRRFEEEFARHPDKHVVIDLTKLVYISSVGLSCVLIASKRVTERGGELVLCGLAGIVREVFQITGFLSIFRIFDTAEAALAGK